MAKRPPILRAREIFAKQQEELSKIGVELQVKDLDHAMSPEVIQFCINHLSSGGRWDELRRKLGLGQAHKDWRWRKLREVLANGLIPRTEEEALKAQADKRAFLIGKLEELESDLEGILQTLTNSKEDKLALTGILKLKLDTIKTQLQETERDYMAFIETRKLKVEDKKKRGVSVIIQNNYHIPRPGDKPEEIDVTTERVTKLVEAKVGSGSN